MGRSGDVTMKGRRNRTGVRAGLLLGLTLVTACGPEPGGEEGGNAPPATDPASLLGSWRVTSVSMPDGTEVTPPAEAAATLDFTDEVDPTGSRLFVGTGGCNRLRGGYDAGSTGRISFGAAASTMMACPEPVMRGEQALLGALETAEGYDVDGDRLEITFEGGAIHLVRGGAVPPGG